MRPLRKKLDHATAFHSDKGCQAGFFLTILRLNAHQQDEPWVFSARSIVTMLCKADP